MLFLIKFEFGTLHFCLTINIFKENKFLSFKLVKTENSNILYYDSLNKLTAIVQSLIICNNDSKIYSAVGIVNL